MEQQSLYDISGETYHAFTEKFKPKLTTDDCYTPELVYEAVAGYVADVYDVERGKMVRPFWPGGDYESWDYWPGCCVVDNPPFSILAQIIRFYCAHDVRFFLFAPALTLFTATECPVCYLPCAVSVTYANGAQVSTSFVTNLDPAKVRTVPELYRRVLLADKQTQAVNKVTLPKYSYPDEVITAAICQRWSKYGVDFAVMPEDCIFVGALDSQRQAKKHIFGGGYLLRPRAAAERAAAERAAAERAAAERAAAERAAAERWPLSDREKTLLGMKVVDPDQMELWC